MRLARWSSLTILLTAFLIVSPLMTPALAQQQQQHSLDPANMDLSVDPAEDFYRFANGGWLDRTEIPSDEGSYGVFNELDDLTREQLLTVLNEAEASGTLQEGSDEWKAVELYRQGNDIDTRNTQGVEPIQPLLDEVDAIDTVDSLHEFQQTAELSWLTGLYWIFVMPDLQDSTTNVTYLSGPFLGLFNRDYYLEDTEENEEIRAAYIETCAEFLMYAGYDEAEAREAAEAVYDFERSLAEVTLTREEQQDFSLMYNPMTLAELEAAYPLMDWEAYFAALGLTGVDSLIVTEKEYLESLQGIIETTPLDVVKDFYKLEIFWSFASFLSDDINQTAFDFETVLFGTPEQSPLEERTLDQTNGMLPDAIGRLYVDAYFPPEAKEEITALVEAEIAAFRIRLEDNPWMSPETRAKALEKLDAMSVKVGYPDEWRSYEAVEIGDSYVGSFLSAVQADTLRNLDQAGEPVDREEWFTPPQVVNAFYNPTLNEIVFPAAILQPPFFEYGGDPAANFGGIGMVIGHELTHGFDLQGSQFDAQGNLVNWWTEEDYAEFDALNQQVVEHYNAIEVLPGLTIDGQITVTENVADLGGVQIAYDALLIYLDQQVEAGAMSSPIASPMATPITSPMASPVGVLDVDDLTPQQRFFLAAATVWREEIRDESLQFQVMNDTHSPGQVRGVVPLQHTDEFHEAFDIQPGDPMYLPPEERIVIW
jgi:predicted metalloendopeptidase